LKVKSWNKLCMEKGFSKESWKWNFFHISWSMTRCQLNVKLSKANTFFPICSRQQWLCTLNTTQLQLFKMKKIQGCPRCNTKLPIAWRGELTILWHLIYLKHLLEYRSYFAFHFWLWGYFSLTRLCCIFLSCN
jgi:hypothetical protein